MSRVRSLLRPIVDSDRSLLATEANASLAGSNVMRDHRWYSDVVKNVRSEAVWFQVSTAVWARVRSDAFVFGRYMSSMAVFGIWKFVPSPMSISRSEFLRSALKSN